MIPCAYQSVFLALIEIFLMSIGSIKLLFTTDSKDETLLENFSIEGLE